MSGFGGSPVLAVTKTHADLVFASRWLGALSLALR
jgi:hypothetical protein